MDENERRRYSRVVVDGVEQAPSRAMLRAVGFKEEDFHRPQIGIASTWSMITPCNMHVNDLAQIAAKGADDAGGAPHAVALMQRRYAGVLAGESLVVGTQTRSAQFGIDLRPTLTRHGQIDTRLILVNSNAEPASLSMSLAGHGIARDTVAPGAQVVVSLRDEFGADAHGVVELESDLELTVSARQTVTNLRAEVVEAELPALSGGTFFPFVPNGQGLSTEFRFANLSDDRIDGTLVFMQSNGEPAAGTILR